MKDAWLSPAITLYLLCGIVAALCTVREDGQALHLWELLFVTLTWPLLLLVELAHFITRIR